MKHVEFVPTGVCSRLISFDLSDDGRIHNLGFLGGCSGNLKAISKLLEGRSAKEAATILNGNTCVPNIRVPTASFPTTAVFWIPS